MRRKENPVDWSDPTLQRWLGTITRPSTRYVYRSAFKVYAHYTGMTGTQLIDEALEDVKLDPRHRKDVVLTRLIGFYNYLKNDYEIKSRGKGPHKVIRKGLSDKLSHMYVNAVRSFYGTFDIVVRLKGRHRLPKARVRNKRMIVGAEQVKMLIDHARTPRDRAIILTLFQGGMDASTLCSLRFGDLAEGLENEHPLRLDLYRPKTGVEHYTFLGRDAVEAIKAYTRDAQSRGLTFNHNTPLFIKERSRGEPLTTNLVQNMMREVAIKSQLIDEEMNGKAFNPLGPHALRESFGSIMINSGVPDTIVDFWLGHAIGEMAEAYKGVQYESLKKMYLEREHILSVTRGLDEKELEEKVTAKVDERIQSLQKIITNYATENLEVKSRLGKVELEITDLKKALKKLLD